MSLSFLYWFIWAVALILSLWGSWPVTTVRPLLGTVLWFALFFIIGYKLFGSFVTK